MKLSYERVDIKSLKFDKRNARKHDAKNIKAIKDSLLKFSQQKPIVAMEDGTVIAGNGTLQAAIELGWETIDVHWTTLNKEEAIAYGLADNRSAELAVWDDENLKGLLDELDQSGWDLDGLGFDINDFKTSDVDYSIIDDNGQSQNLDDMRSDTRKAIQIEFEPADYEQATALVKLYREKGIYVGKMLIDCLMNKKGSL